MKTLFIIYLIILLSCDSSNGNEKEDDIAPTVKNKIEDFQVEEGEKTKRIDLTGTFDDPDNNNDKIVKTVESNSNTELLNASISNHFLDLEFKEGKTGKAIIVIKGLSNGKSVTEKFEVTVVENRTLQSLNQGSSNYSSGNYKDAEKGFSDAVNFGDSRYLEKSYLGLAVTQLKMQKHSESYTNFKKGLALEKSEYDNDFKAGIALLEYAHMKNYSASIENSLDVLKKDPKFQMNFDEKMDYKDLRLVLALCYYDIKDFTKSLAEVKKLDEAFQLSESDLDFEFKLAKKLNDLSTGLKNKF